MPHTGTNAYAMADTTLYVLRLAGGRWYVGTTRRFAARLAAHRRGAGAAWTQAHRVVSVAARSQVPEDVAGFREDAKVLELMQRHGVNKVRGGTYAATRLSRTQRDEIHEKLRHNQGRCTRCGRAGHYLSACYARTSVDGEPLHSDSSEWTDSDDSDGSDDSLTVDDIAAES